jgi:hypothetical protein
MEAIQHVGGMVFHVRSDDPVRARKEDGKPYYVVDTTSYSGRGRCDCRDYRIRLEKDVANGKRGLRCKHLTKVLIWLGLSVTAEFIKTYGPTKDT